MTTYTIGKLAERADVGIETIRFYERRGLIPEPPRTGSGYRQYPESEAARIRFIKRGQELGFSLSEIKELLALRVDTDMDCGDVRRRAEAKIADVERKIRDLQAMKNALEALTLACAGRGSTSECPILDAMDVGASA